MIETLIAIPSWCALADSVSRMSSPFAETAEKKKAVVVMEDAYYPGLGIDVHSWRGVEGMHICMCLRCV